jgi:hypothetical protein
VRIIITATQRAADNVSHRSIAVGNLSWSALAPPLLKGGQLPDVFGCGVKLFSAAVIIVYPYLYADGGRFTYRILNEDRERWFGDIRRNKLSVTEISWRIVPSPAAWRCSPQSFARVSSLATAYQCLT